MPPVGRQSGLGRGPLRRPRGLAGTRGAEHGEADPLPAPPGKTLPPWRAFHALHRARAPMTLPSARLARPTLLTAQPRAQRVWSEVTPHTGLPARRQRDVLFQTCFPSREAGLCERLSGPISAIRRSPQGFRQARPRVLGLGQSPPGKPQRTRGLPPRQDPRLEGSLRARLGSARPGPARLQNGVALATSAGGFIPRGGTRHWNMHKNTWGQIVPVDVWWPSIKGAEAPKLIA
ncbi:uncharacterized protein LOC142419938 [Mycteria americana]|uniref:uncharacterized protein LOC142419938 n=1 Tax=Mycteria americana TaxID=33587 RepID=UPI003F58EA16